MFIRIVLSLLAFIMIQTAASAFDGFRTTLDCSYQEQSEFFTANIGLGLSDQMQQLDAIYAYPTIDGTQLDAKSKIEDGKLKITVFHLDETGAGKQIDQHQINIDNGSIVSSVIAPDAREAFGDCMVRVEEPVPSEGCAFFGSESDFVRGGAFCANQQLADHKDISYGAGNLWTDGAWCTSLKETQPAEISFFYAGYNIFGSAPKAARLMVVNGYDKSDSAFKNNARAKTINVKSGNYFFETYELHDTAELQYLDLGFEVTMSDIVVEIVDTYPGAKYEDLCVSTIGADFEFDPDYPYPGELYAKRLSGGN